jgi:hypothetical protein
MEEHRKECYELMIHVARTRLCRFLRILTENQRYQKIPQVLHALLIHLRTFLLGRRSYSTVDSEVPPINVNFECLR